MGDWEAPAKINFDLRIGSVDRTGMHPLRSLVQTIEWCDQLTIESADDDRLVIDGTEESVDLPSGGDNLVWRAINGLADGSARPRLDIALTKSIPIAAGLGGGSADAAACLVAAGEMMGAGDAQIQAAAQAVGADVPLFLRGGTQLMEGYGERLTALDSLGSMSVAVVVAPFELSTADVYGGGDRLDGPTGPVVGGRLLPPPLRGFDELRNDLVPAAVSLRPELADWMADLAERWSVPIFMSGSGPSCFGCFSEDEEAAEALAEVVDRRDGRAVSLRSVGVARRRE